MQILRDTIAPGDVLQINAADTEAIRRAWATVDAAVLAGDLPSEAVEAPGLQWVHLVHAGVERSAKPQYLRGGLRISGGAGRSSEAQAEHALFLMQALNYRYPVFLDAQRARCWGVPGQGELKALHGRTLGVVGLGHTGQALVRKARAFGMSVIAYRRRNVACEHVDELYCQQEDEGMESLLSRSDFVVLTASLNDQSYQLIGTEEFALMKPSAFLVNVARGGLVDENALVQALRGGVIAGAATDVATREPLPPSSPLWSAPNLLITPHCAPRMSDREERMLALTLDNIERFCSGRELRNEVTAVDMYTRRDVGHGCANLRDRLYRLWQRFIRRLKVP